MGLHEAFPGRGGHVPFGRKMKRPAGIGGLFLTIGSIGG
jgi:hypothetical protein